MIDLNSNRWAGLEHAYGDASDIPALLGRLSAGDGSVLDELYGTVCHQGSIYGASYAAVPHLVAAAKSLDDHTLRAEILILVGAIRASRDDRSRAQPSDDVLRAFATAISEALPLALQTVREDLDGPTSVFLLEAAATLQGFGAVGASLSGFVDEEFSLACPGCGCDLYVWPDERGLFAAAEDPVSVPTTKKTRVEKGPVVASASASAYEWLLEVGGPTALREIGDGLPFLFGTARCPRCDHAFVLMDALDE